MEPIKINVNVEVGLKQATLEALKGIFGAQIIPAPAKSEEPQTQPVKTQPAPAPVPAPADDDDLPPDDAPDPAPDPAPKKTPTEAEMRAEIQKTRKRGVPAKTIRDYIQSTFGVETSVECPEDRRQELIDGLAKLAA